MTSRQFIVGAAALTAGALTVAVAACKTTASAPASTPATKSAPAGPSAPLDQKVGWILRLEQSRALRDGPAGTPPLSAPTSFAPANTADLGALVRDSDPAIRRRAALAIGRVGDPDGTPLLVAALADPDEGVRAQAAFALGLVLSPAAVAPLEHALDDASVLVRARAIDALGLIGDVSAGPAITKVSAGCSATLAPLAPDDDEWPKALDVEACRAALEALVRLKSYDGITAIAFDAHGQLSSRWWPIAFAFQRLNDARGADTLLDLAGTPGVYTASFAMRGLASLADRRVLPIAQASAGTIDTDVRLRVTAVRALGQLGGAQAVTTLTAIVQDPKTPRNLAIEAVTALGRAHAAGAFDLLIDEASDPWAAMRAAALEAAVRVNPEGFGLVVGSLGTDRDPSVRAALAGVLAELAPDRARSAIEDLTSDTDVRVQGPALEALAKVGAPDLTTKLFAALEAPDFVVRTTAARLIGEHRPEGGVAHLTAALARAQSDAAYDARAAVVDALAAYGGDEAKAAIRPALDDKEWPVRVRAAEALRRLGDATARPLRPAPLRNPPAYFESDGLLHPKYSPHALIEVSGNTIEIELNVVDAPFSSASFIELARAGFFNGVKIHRVVPDFVVQDGDPRGDGEGGPGYTIRDELSPIPFVRGTVGMALDFPETGGSQFFVTLSPQPHLDDKYAVFGKVVRGAEWLDQIAQGDTITRVRIWDGTSFE